MASPAKKLMTSEEFGGYVQEVTEVVISPVSTHYKFILQTDSSTFESVSSFATEKHDLFKTCANDKTFVKLYDVKKDYDILFNGTSKVTLTEERPFPYSAYTDTIPTCTIREVKELDDDTMVTVTGRVLSVGEQRTPTKYSPTKPIFRTTAKISDDTGDIELILWKNEFQLQIGSTYRFRHVTKSTYQGRNELKANNSWTRITESMGPYQSLQLPTDVFCPAEIKMADIRILATCPSCGEVNQFPCSAQTLKCEICKGRHLLKDYVITLQGNFRVKVDSSIIALTVPSEVLLKYAAARGMDVYNDNFTDDLEISLLLDENLLYSKESGKLCLEPAEAISAAETVTSTQSSQVDVKYFNDVCN